VTDKLKSKLQQIRDLKSKGSGFEVQAMYQIIDLERTSVLWRKDRSTTFDDVLKEEKGLCTPSRFQAFKKATSCFPKDTIHKLGVPCVCLLAVQNGQQRDRLLRYALNFRTKNGSEPTYQYICMFLKKPNTGPTRTQLLKYINVLRAKIKDLGGYIPVMER
jgi:hypothetical protein